MKGVRKKERRVEREKKVRHAKRARLDNGFPNGLRRSQGVFRTKQTY